VDEEFTKAIPQDSGRHVTEGVGCTSKAGKKTAWDTSNGAYMQGSGTNESK